MTDFYALSVAEQEQRLARFARAALEHWGLETATLRLIKFRENAVFEAVTASQRRYAVRIHRPGYHTDAELRSELQWMRALQTSGIDVPEPVVARSGELFIGFRHAEVPEPRQIDVFEWIDGVQLGSVEAGATADARALIDTYTTVGALAAKLHLHAISWSRPADFTRHAWDAAGLVGEQPLWGRFWELEALSGEQRALIVSVRDRLRADLNSLPRTRETYGLIHADFAPENLLVDGTRVRLIDFDDAGFGWYLFEIATSLYFHTDQPNYEAIRAATVNGYRSLRPIPEDQLALLPMFLAARGLTYLGWVHTRKETATARELTPMLIELVCRAARDYLRID